VDKTLQKRNSTDKQLSAKQLTTGPQRNYSIRSRISGREGYFCRAISATIRLIVFNDMCKTIEGTIRCVRW